MDIFDPALASRHKTALSKRVPQLDGLRGLAALIVAFSHAGNTGLIWRNPQSGQLGVMLFFVLSGFLMAWLYGEREMSWRAWLDYAARRFFRVYPLFALAVVWSVYVARWSYNIPPEAALDHFLLRDGEGVLWTIPVEIKYYLIFPLIAICLYGLPSLAHKIGVLVALITFFALVRMPTDNLAPWRFLPYFLGGYLAALILPKAAELRDRVRGLGLGADVACALVLGAIVFTMPSVWNSLMGERMRAWLHPEIYVPLFASVVLLTCLSPRLAPALLANPVARFVGTISFSLYLSHLIVLRYVRAQGLGEWTLLVAALAVLLVATVLWALVERPSQQIGHLIGRLTRKPPERRVGASAAELSTPP